MLPAQMPLNRNRLVSYHNWIGFASVVHWIMSPLKRYINVPTYSTLKCDFIWKQGLHRGNQVKMRSLEWDLIRCDWCPYEMGNYGHGRAERQDVKTHSDDHVTRVTDLWPRNAKDCRQIPEARGSKEGFFPRAESLALLTQLSRTSDFQNRKVINYCCFKPPTFWYFIMAALGNEYSFV